MGTPIESDEVQGNEGDVEPDNSPGPNPAWNDVLGVIPEQFHQMVTPHFQKWDQAAQDRVTQANETVAQYEPYKAFIEHGIDPSELENSLRLAYEINNNPQAVYNALGSAYGLAGTEAAANEEEEPETPPNPAANAQAPNQEYTQLREGLELVSKIILDEQNAKAQAADDAALESELASLKKKHGDYDEGYVLAMMTNGATGDQAIEAYKTMRNSLLQSSPRPFAPNIMGSSGGGAGVPSQQIDPTKLSSGETKKLVAQMLAAEFGPKP